MAVSSGTAGLHLAMLALGIGAGDEVIVPSFTFIAAANAIRYVGATPVFVDIDCVTLNLSPAAVEQAINSRTRAIVAVHTFGVPADMPALAELARLRHLFLVEDACEALGATMHSQPVGSFGDVAVFAFYPNKQITTGEGGMIVTRDRVLAAKMRSLRNQGRAPTDSWLQHTEIGFNYRLSEIACTLGIGQMRRLASILDRREQIAGMYRQHLGAEGHLTLPIDELPGCRISWFVYVVRLADAFTAGHRDQVIRELDAGGHRLRTILRAHSSAAGLRRCSGHCGPLRYRVNCLAHHCPSVLQSHQRFTDRDGMRSPETGDREYMLITLFL